MSARTEKVLSFLSANLRTSIGSTFLKRKPPEMSCTSSEKYLRIESSSTAMLAQVGAGQLESHVAGFLDLYLAMLLTAGQAQPLQGKANKSFKPTAFHAAA